MLEKPRRFRVKHRRVVGVAVGVAKILRCVILGTMEMHEKHFKEWMGVKEKLHYRVRVPNITVGEIWWCGIGENVGVEINGKSMRFTRPVLILKKYGRFGFLGIPLTSQVKIGSWFVNFEFLGKRQYAALSQARFISTSRLYEKIGQVPNSDLSLVKSALLNLIG